MDWRGIDAGLDPGRFTGGPAGKLSGALLEKIENATRYCLGL